MRKHYTQYNISKNYFSFKEPAPDTSCQIRQAIAPAGITGTADIAVINANLHGYDDADTVLIKGRHIAEVGNFENIKGFIGESTKVIDAGNGYLFPGLCDSHVHLMIGVEHYQGCDVDDVRSFEDLSQRIKTFISENKDLDVVHVYGLHYMDTPIIPAKRARECLDTIVCDRPLFIYAHDLHTGWVNTSALKISGFFEKMPPWPQAIEQLGQCDNIELDSQGYPSGELREPESYFMVEGNLRIKFPLSVEQKLDYLHKTCCYLNSLGITSVHNMGLDLQEEDFELLLLLLELEEQGRLPLRVSNSFSVVPDEHVLTDIDNTARIRDALRKAADGEMLLGNLHKLLVDEMEQVSKQRHNAFKSSAQRAQKHISKAHHQCSSQINSMIYDIHVKPHIERVTARLRKIGNKIAGKNSKVELKGIKIFMDGVVEKDTAYCSGIARKEGIPAFNPEELQTTVNRADRLGLQVCAHCIGDASVTATLDVVEKVRELHAGEDTRRGHRIRHRIEHIELCSPGDIKRFHEYDVIPSMQPLHERPPVTMWHEKVPESKWETAFPWQSFLSTGASLTFGSDWPIVSCNCIEGLQRAVTRLPWKTGMINQGVSFEQGLRAFTGGNAYAEYHENIRGQIKPGMLADLAVFSGKLSEHAPSPSELQCICTICDGEVVFQNSSHCKQ